MNIFTVREAARYCRQWCLDGKGPIVMDVKTYRYHGHSMSDPGITYRTREEVSDMRSNRDPIDKLKNTMLQNNMATEDEIKVFKNLCLVGSMPFSHMALCEMAMFFYFKYEI